MALKNYDEHERINALFRGINYQVLISLVPSFFIYSFFHDRKLAFTWLCINSLSLVFRFAISHEYNKNYNTRPLKQKLKFEYGYALAVLVFATTWGAAPYLLEIETSEQLLMLVLCSVTVLIGILNNVFYSVPATVFAATVSVLPTSYYAYLHSPNAGRHLFLLFFLFLAFLIVTSIKQFKVFQKLIKTEQLLSHKLAVEDELKQVKANSINNAKLASMG